MGELVIGASRPQPQAGGNRGSPGYGPDDPRSTWNLTPSDSDRNQRPGGYEPDELPNHVSTLNLGDFAGV